MERLRGIIKSLKLPKDKLMLWLKDRQLYCVDEEGWVPIVADLSFLREIYSQLESKQVKLKAGEGIEVDALGNIRSTLDLSLYRTVTELPTENIEANKIYLVVGLPTKEGNKFTEYIYRSDSEEWEKIGESKPEWTYFDYPKIKLTTTDGLPYTIRINVNKEVTINSDEWYTIDDELISAMYMFGSSKNNSEIQESRRLLSVDLSKFDTSTILNASGMFNYCSNLTDIIGIENLDWSSNTNLGGMFSNGAKFNHNLDLSNWDVSNVTSFAGMFGGCTINSLDLSNWDISNVANFGRMFSGCTINSLDLSNWDVSNVTNSLTTPLISDCTIGEINLSNWINVGIGSQSLINRCNIDKLIIRNAVLGDFNGCQGGRIKEIDFTGTIVTNQTTLSNWHQGNYVLERLIWPELTGEGITNIYCMFFLLSHLEYVDLSKFKPVSIDASNSSKYDHCFYQCPDTLVIKTTSAFRDFCIEHAEVMCLPTPLRGINSEQWIITD